jgi:hypothetical protein
MRIPVKAAFLKEAVLIPGCLQAEKTLDQLKTRGIEMYFEEGLLFVTRNNIVGAIPGTSVHSFLIGEKKEASKETVKVVKAK